MTKILHRMLIAWFLLFCTSDLILAEVSCPYIASINLRLKEEEIPRLIAESLVGNEASLTPYFDYAYLGVNDFEEVIGDRKVTLKDSFKALDIRLDDFYYLMDRKTLLHVLVTADINVHHLYSVFLQYFIDDPKEDMPKILNSLNISNDRFTLAVVFGSDKDLLNMLLEGSYSKKNIEKALAFVNQDVTLYNALNFLRVSKLGDFTKLKNSNSTAHLMEGLVGLVTSNNFFNLLRVLNVNAGDFYRNQAFRTVLDDLTDTGEDLIGSLISPDRIITMSYSKTLNDFEILMNFTKLVAQTVEHHGAQHVIEANRIPNYPSVIALKMNRPIDVYEYLKYSSRFEVKNLKNCSYVSVNLLDNSVHSVSVNAELGKNRTLSINRTNGIVFNIGSPLICSGFLYGVAYWEYDESILFLGMKAEPNTRGGTNVIIVYINWFSSLVVDRFCNFLNFINVYQCTNAKESDHYIV